MRRTAAGLALSLLAAGLLAGCGPSVVAYDDGYAVGQSVAAASVRGTLVGGAVLAACRHQWVTSGPATDSRRTWIRGCVAGVRKLEATLGS
jgi:hypothetical protein